MIKKKKNVNHLQIQTIEKKIEKKIEKYFLNKENDLLEQIKKLKVLTMSNGNWILRIGDKCLRINQLDQRLKELGLIS